MLHLDNNIRICKRKFDYDKEYSPVPGMMGTEYVGSDRYAVVCATKDSPKRITIWRLYDLDEDNIKDCDAIYTDDEEVMFLDFNKYHSRRYEVEQWSLRKNGKWREMSSSSSSSIHWGIANPYRDPDF